MEVQRVLSCWYGQLDGRRNPNRGRVGLMWPCVAFKCEAWSIRETLIRTWSGDAGHSLRTSLALPTVRESALSFNLAVLLANSTTGQIRDSLQHFSSYYPRTHALQLLGPLNRHLSTKRNQHNSETQYFCTLSTCLFHLDVLPLQICSLPSSISNSLFSYLFAAIV